MNKNAISNYLISDVAEFKQKMLNWAEQFNIFCFMDNQGYSNNPQQFECLLAVGFQKEIIPVDTFDKMDGFIEGNWAFGHLSYDLGNKWFGLGQKKKNRIAFPDFYFFKPDILIWLINDQLSISAPDPESVLSEIKLQNPLTTDEKVIDLKSILSKEEHISKVSQLQSHIQRGDCYEINFCQEFYAEDISITPVSVFQSLLNESPNPFSVLYKFNRQYLICASPERFLNRTGNKLVSQPIKGTSKRSNDNELDKKLKAALYHSEKERSENVMVVDLVRNDLSAICKEGSVMVDELFGIYTFPQVHQMISTISGVIKDNISFTKIIRSTFPMGSMTGAPKKRVMELIDRYEKGGRGIFSGAVGYIKPDGDFDFNVVIRSIMYNATDKYISCQVGSGITIYSDPEKEWEECLLKAQAIKKVLSKTTGLS